MHALATLAPTAPYPFQHVQSPAPGPSCATAQDAAAFYGFCYERTRTTRDIRRKVRGQLWRFRTQDALRAWLDGADLPDDLDAFSAPVERSKGFWRALVTESQLPQGWRAGDALPWTPEREALASMVKCQSA